MSRGGDREPAMSDMDGRLMALEQNTRGLNARMRAIERSFSGGSRLLPADTGTHEPVPDQPASHTPEMDDFVPASEIAVQYDQIHGQEAPPPELVPGRKNKPVLKLLPFDLTGIVAGLIMVTISILLYTGNMELLKNPLMPLISGILLIMCVCVKLYYQ